MSLGEYAPNHITCGRKISFTICILFISQVIEGGCFCFFFTPHPHIHKVLLCLLHFLIRQNAALSQDRQVFDRVHLHRCKLRTKFALLMISSENMGLHNYFSQNPTCHRYGAKPITCEWSICDVCKMWYHMLHTSSKQTIKRLLPH